MYKHRHSVSGLTYDSSHSLFSLYSFFVHLLSVSYVKVPSSTFTIQTRDYSVIKLDKIISGLSTNEFTLTLRPSEILTSLELSLSSVRDKRGVIQKVYGHLSRAKKLSSPNKCLMNSST